MVQWLGKPSVERMVPGKAWMSSCPFLAPEVAALKKTGRREVPGSFLGRASRPSRSEFSVVFSETRENTG